MATSPRAPFKSLAGNELGIGARGELVTRPGGITPRRVTSPCVHVTGTVSAEGATVANQRDIVLTFKDRRGNAIDYACMVELVVFTTSAMVDFAATGGSTGIAINGVGKLLALVAKKVFRCITSTSGGLNVIYTDTGTESCFLGVRLPNGEVVAIGDLTCA